MTIYKNLEMFIQNEAENALDRIETIDVELRQIPSLSNGNGFYNDFLAEKQLGLSKERSLLRGKFDAFMDFLNKLKEKESYFTHPMTTREYQLSHLASFLNEEDTEFTKKNNSQMQAGDRYAIGFSLAYQTLRKHLQFLHKEVKKADLALTKLRSIKKFCNGRGCENCIHHQNEGCLFASFGIGSPKTWDSYYH